MAIKQMAHRAKVIPELVGVWELTPANKFLPEAKTLTVQADAGYTLVSKSDKRAKGVAEGDPKHRAAR